MLEEVKVNPNLEVCLADVQFVSPHDVSSKVHQFRGVKGCEHSGHDSSGMA